jgi:hypothetical protein
MSGWWRSSWILVVLQTIETMAQFDPQVMAAAAAAAAAAASNVAP